jgi:hypothetical protein
LAQLTNTLSGQRIATFPGFSPPTLLSSPSSGVESKITEGCPLATRLHRYVLYRGDASANEVRYISKASPISVNRRAFFGRLGRRVRELRRKHGHSQEDMILFGFSARHWQQIEAGRPITVSTLLRICAVFRTSLERLVRGLDEGIYED